MKQRTEVGVVRSHSEMGWPRMEALKWLCLTHVVMGRGDVNDKSKFT